MSQSSRVEILKKCVYFLIFSFLMIAWIFIHEVAHFVACESIGNSAEIIINTTKSTTNCVGEAPSRAEGTYIYMAPYILDILVLIPIFWFRYVRNRTITDSLPRMLPYVLAFDVSKNYFDLVVLHQQTDFWHIFNLLDNYRYFSLIPVIMTVIGSILIAKMDWEELKRT